MYKPLSPYVRTKKKKKKEKSRTRSIELKQQVAFRIYQSGLTQNYILLLNLDRCTASSIDL